MESELLLFLVRKTDVVLARGEGQMLLLVDEISFWGKLGRLDSEHPRATSTAKDGGIGKRFLVEARLGWVNPHQ
jgi:hypothetical protein